MNRLKYLKNAPNGNGSIATGYIFQVPITAPLIGEGGVHDLYKQSAIQRYALGTRLVTADGRVFRYAKCSADKTSGQALFFAAGRIATRAADGGATLPVAIVAGDDHCHVTIAATDGSNYGDAGAPGSKAADGSITKDELYGGYLYVYGTSSGATYQRENRMIIGNDAVAAGGGTMLVKVEEPFTYAHSVSIKIEVWPNPWSALVSIPSNNMSCAGFPACGNVTSGYYIWCQTWGPCRISGQNYNLGEAEGERQLWFGPDGSIRSSAIQGATNCRQLAGFLLYRTSSAATGGDTFLMLQICP